MTHPVRLHTSSTLCFSSNHHLRGLASFASRRGLASSTPFGQSGNTNNTKPALIIRHHPATGPPSFFRLCLCCSPSLVFFLARQPLSSSFVLGFHFDGCLLTFLEEGNGCLKRERERDQKDRQQRCSFDLLFHFSTKFLPQFSSFFFSSNPLR